MTTPPLQIDDDVKEAVECLIYSINPHPSGTEEANTFQLSRGDVVCHHVQTLLNARLKEANLSLQIWKNTFPMGIEHAFENSKQAKERDQLKQQLLSQALTIEGMKEEINKACVSFEAIVVESKRLQPGKTKLLSAETEAKL